MAEENENPNGRGGTPPPATPGVFDGLSPEAKGFVDLKGFKDVESVIKSYQEAEKKLGYPADKILRMPDENDVEGQKAFLEKLGVPKTADEYKFEVPEEQKEFIKKVAPLLHKAGLSQKAAAGLVKEYNVLYDETQALRITQHQQKQATEEIELKQEWGGTYEANVELAKRAAKTFGIDEQTMAAQEQTMGFKAFMKHYQAIGAAMGEDKMLGAGGGHQQFAMTPEAAAEKIKTNMSNPQWRQKYNEGDKATVDEYMRLSKIRAGYGA